MRHLEVHAHVLEVALGDLALVHAVLVVHQALQEAADVAEQLLLGRVPRLVLVRHLARLGAHDVLAHVGQQHDARREDVVDAARRLLHRLALAQVLLVERVERGHGGLDGGQRGLEVALGVGLDGRGARRHLARLAGDGVGLGRLLLDDGLVGGHVGGDDGRLGLLGLGLDELDLELLLDLAHERARLAQLLEAGLQAVDGGGAGHALAGEQRLVELEQLEVGLGRRVDEAAVRVLVAHGHLVHALEGEGHVALDARAHGVAEALDVLEELGADGLQRVLGPGLEPVEHRAVDERREALGARLDVLADGREAQHHVQVALHRVDEPLPARVLVHGEAGGLDAAAHGVDDGVHLVGREEVRDVAAGQQVVHGHEEALIDDLRVREEEHDALLLDARDVVHLLEVLLEVAQAVVAADDDLRHLVVADEGAEAAEALLARAAHADEQRVARGVEDDARDAAHVLERVLEEHEVHGRVDLVVLAQALVEDALEAVHAHDPVVHLLERRLDEVAEDKLRAVGPEEVAHVDRGELLLALRERERAVLLEVLAAHEAVAVDALGLVQPELDHALDRLELVGLRHEHALEDAREVAHGELVVEVGRALAEGRAHAGVQQQRAAQQRLAAALHVLVEGLEVSLEEGAEDGVQARRAGEADGQREEVALQARVYDEGAGGRVERAHELRVLDVLEAQLGAVVPVAVVQQLAHDGDGRLRVVLVDEGQVEVVEVVDHVRLADGPVVDAGLLLERRLHDDLQRARVREVVEVDHVAQALLGLLHGQQTVHELRLAAAGVAHEHDGVALRHEVLHPEDDGAGLGRRHRDRGHGRLARVEVDGLEERAVLPRVEGQRHGVEVVVEDRVARAELDLLEFALPELGEARAVVLAVLEAQRAAEGPHAGEDEVGVEDARHLLGRAGRVAHLLEHGGRVEALERADEVGHERHVLDGHHGLALLLDEEQRRRAVAVEEAAQAGAHVLGRVLLARVVLELEQPGLDDGAPLRARVGRDVDDTRAAHRRRRGVVEVADLEDHAHVALERDALV